MLKSHWSCVRVPCWGGLNGVMISLHRGKALSARMEKVRERALPGVSMRSRSLLYIGEFEKTLQSKSSMHVLLI